MFAIGSNSDLSSRLPVFLHMVFVTSALADPQRCRGRGCLRRSNALSAGSCCQAALGVFLLQPGSRGWKSGGAQKLKVGVTSKENMNQYLFPPIPTAVVIGINKYCFIFLLVVTLFFPPFYFLPCSASEFFHTLPSSDLLPPILLQWRYRQLLPPCICGSSMAEVRSKSHIKLDNWGLLTIHVHI